MSSFSFYPNFFFLGSIIIQLFVLYVGYLFFSVEKRSKSTTSLMYALLSMVFFHGGYTIACSFYASTGAWHRILTVFFALFGTMMYTQIFFHFPTTRYEKFGNTLFKIQLTIVSLTTLYFMSVVIGADKIYHFGGHYWDFAADTVSKQISLIILLFFAICMGCGIFRAVKEKDQRRVILAIAISFFVISAVPGALNTMSRDGKVSRALYTTVTDVMNLIGFFAVVVVYINNTRDRTSFMGKIVGISLLTILLAFQAISYYWVEDREEAYDLVKRQETARILASGESSPDMKYAVSYNPETRELTYNTEKPDVSEVILKASLANKVFAMQLNQLKQEEDWAVTLQGLLASAPPSFDGYNRLISYQFGLGIDSAEEMLEALKKTDRLILFYQGKIAGVDPENFKESATPILGKKAPSLEPMLNVLRQILNDCKDGVSCKEKILAELTPLDLPGERNYRGSRLLDRGGTEPQHYVSFAKMDPNSGVIQEVGFNYEAYRSFVSSTALKMTYIMILVVLFIIIGYQFFFAGALVNPLDEVIAGLKQANKGDYDTRVPIHVEDEIGFLARSFNKMIRSIKVARLKLQEYADGLEAKVEERTKELQETLNHVEALKKQQDGDYFLTTLLIKPLSINNIHSDELSVTFFQKQKKTFSFRNREDEIGGDMNIAHTLHLRDKRYSLVLNADAMGKSMQGAGGALVLGAVFQSIVERTKLDPAIKKQHPEQWLKFTFIELHNIFESFDGSMLISLLMALIDDEAGLVYYMNAEHPQGVLYRDGKASFFDVSPMYRKLGTTITTGGIEIMTFQMQPGDKLYFGSDGRDDLLLGHNEDGHRIINEDEDLFLIHLEEAKGDIDRCYEILKNKGEITDDLTLVLIEYHGRQYEEVQSKENAFKKLQTDLDSAADKKTYLQQSVEKEPLWREGWMSLAELLKSEKKYQDAGLCFETAFALNPGDMSLMLRIAENRIMGKETERAIDILERYRTRKKDNPSVLLQLAKLYSDNGNKIRALKLSKESNEYKETAEAQKLVAELESEGISEGIIVES